MKRYILIGLVALALVVAGCGGGNGNGNGNEAAQTCAELSDAFFAGDAQAGAEWERRGCEQVEADAEAVEAEELRQRAEGWAEAWCRVQLGMTLAEADELMGEPTGVFAEQHEWDAYQWSFTAFANSDGTVRQLDSSEDGSTPETSSVKCGEPVLGVPSAKMRKQ
jgi:hypothetical protein